MDSSARLQCHLVCAPFYDRESDKQTRHRECWRPHSGNPLVSGLVVLYIINIIKKIIFQGSGGRTKRFVFTTRTFGQNFFISHRTAADYRHCSKKHIILFRPGNASANVIHETDISAFFFRGNKSVFIPTFKANGNYNTPTVMANRIEFFNLYSIAYTI